MKAAPEFKAQSVPRVLKGRKAIQVLKGRRVQLGPRDHRDLRVRKEARELQGHRGTLERKGRKVRLVTR